MLNKEGRIESNYDEIAGSVVIVLVMLFLIGISLYYQYTFGILEEMNNKNIDITVLILLCLLIGATAIYNIVKLRAHNMNTEPSNGEST